MRRSFLTILAIISLGLAACSDEADPSDGAAGEEQGADDGDVTDGDATDGDATDGADGDGSRDAFVGALVDDLEGDPDFPLDATQAECFAAAFVDTLGVEELEDAGITPEDLAADEVNSTALAMVEAERDALADAAAECDLTDTFSRVLTDELGVTGESAACVAESIDEQEFAELLIAAILGEQDSEAAGEAYGESIMAGLEPDCAKDIVVALLVGEGVVSAEMETCFAENLDADLARRLLDVEEQESDPEGLQADLQVVLLGCT